MALLTLVAALTSRLWAQTNETPARLAIISESPAFAAVADLLTVELSAKPQMQVLERAEIEKLYREQQLSAANRDYVKLGQVLGADGLLFMNLTADGTNRFLSARLVAVKPGVVLENLRTPWPVPDAPGWARWVANHFAPLLPKLSVSAKDAIPISVVNLRSAVRSVEAQELERQLTVLLIERLTRERELFVLERRRMDLLGAEKELQGMGESTFWNGSYLLDGTIDRDGYAKDTMTVHAQLAAPVRGDSIVLVLNSTRGDLSGMTDRATGAIMGALRRSSPKGGWQPEEEARNYFEEAKWAFKWELVPEARAAIESSWALGQQDKEGAALRVRIHNKMIGRRVGTIVKGELRTLFPPQPTMSERLQTARRTLELHNAAFSRFVASDSKVDGAWYELTFDMLEATSVLLGEFWLRPELCRGEEENLAEVRALGRQVFKLLEANATWARETRKKSPGWAATRGCYYFDGPEQGVQAYRQLVEEGLFPLAAESFTFRYPCDVEREDAPLLVGWTPVDRQKAPRLWRAFVGELCASTNVAERLAGCYLDCYHATSDPHYAESVRRLFAAAGETAFQLVAAGMDASFEHTLEEMVGHKQSPHVHEGHDRLASAEVAALWRGFEDARSEGARLLRVKTLQSYLRTDSQLNAARLGSSEFSSLLLKTNEVADVRELLKQYEARVREEGTNESRGGSRDRDEVINRITAFSERLGIPASSPSSIHAMAGTRQPQPTVKQPTPVSTNILDVRSFWTAPFAVPDRSTQVAIVACTELVPGGFREGRFWLQFGNEGRPKVLCAVKLPSFETETFPLPEGWLHHFEVFGRWVYVSVDDRITRYSLRDGKWQDLAVPAQGGAVFSLVNGRLLFCTPDGIVALAEDGQSGVILASRRRRPAANALDALEWSGRPLLIEGTNGLARVLIGKTVYDLRADGEWAESARLPDRFKQVVNSARHPEGLLCTGKDETGWLNWLWLPNDASEFELLFMQPTMTLLSFGSSGSLPPPPRIHVRMRMNPRWPSPPRPPVTGWGGCYEQGRLALLEGGLVFQDDGRGRGEFKLNKGAHLGLAVFADGFQEPLRIPLRLATSKAVFGPELIMGLQGTSTADRKVYTRSFESHFFVHTPAGAVLGARRAPGFWFIPTAEMQQRLGAHLASQKAAEDRKRHSERAKWQSLADHYHFTDHNRLTPSEREAMVGDPLFIELELPHIDSNRDGWLNAEELDYFDANQNRHLDAQEELGVDHAQRLLGAAMLQNADADGNGLLEPGELRNALIESQLATENSPLFSNPKKAMDTAGIVSFLGNVTRQKAAGVWRAALQKKPSEYMAYMRNPKERADSLKAYLDYCWRHAPTNTATSGAVSNVTSSASQSP